MSISDELEKLSKLKADGLMSDEEFTQAKTRLLDSAEQDGGAAPSGNLPAEKGDFNANQWAMFLHLSQLGNFVIPFSGIVAPIVLWQMKKDESPVIDRHGKMVVNWMISAFIYALICMVLSLIIIGIFGLMALGVISIIFAIIGGVKANNGEFWEYPMSIKFLK